MSASFSFVSLLAKIKKCLAVLFNTSTVLALTILISIKSFADETLYQQCVACHGQQGEGNEALKAPAIAGQDAKYFIRQLVNFNADVRGKAEQAKPMAAIAKGLLKVDIDKLAIYVQAMPSSKKINNNSIAGNLKNGSRYYQAKCGACHGGQAQGNKAFNAPRLANQSNKYLLQQMQDFVDGKRGYEQRDKFGRQMAMMANTTKGQELKDILFYISKQEAKLSGKSLR